MKHLLDQRNFRVPIGNWKNFHLLVMKEVIVKANCFCDQNSQLEFLKNSTAKPLLAKNTTVEVEITKDKMQKNGNERRYDTFLGSFPIEIL